MTTRLKSVFVLCVIVFGAIQLALADDTNAHQTVTGILTDPDFRVKLHALEQRYGVETLAEPEVITTSGREVQRMRADYIFQQPQYATVAVTNTSLAQLEIRVFKVDMNIFLPNLQKAAKSSANADIAKIAADYFASKGINLEPPKSIAFNDRLGSLFVKATSQDLDKIEKIVVVLNNPLAKVHIASVAKHRTSGLLKFLCLIAALAILVTVSLLVQRKIKSKISPQN